MKTELSKIAQDLEQDTVTTEQAQTLLLGLFCKEYSLFWNNCYNKTCVYNVSSTCKNRNIGSTCQGHVS